MAKYPKYKTKSQVKSSDTQGVAASMHAPTDVQEDRLAEATGTCNHEVNGETLTLRTRGNQEEEEGSRVGTSHVDAC